MNQALALILDAYRELRSKRLFWITLGLSAAFIGGFALIGYNDEGLTLVGHQFEFPGAGAVYVPLFRFLVVGIWLTWAATILALVSTAGIFPDLLVSGTIDLYLARPISRLRLFFIKYLCGLGFVTLQVLIVCLGGFLVMKWRGHIWMPSLFAAVPLVLLMFSYVFSLCVLLGVWTRSTIAALLLAIVGWGLFAGIQYADHGLLWFQRVSERRVEAAERTLSAAEAELRRYQQHPSEDLFGVKGAMARMRQQRARNSLPALRDNVRLPRILHSITYAVQMIVPKTWQTTDLMDRLLFTDVEATARDEAREQRLEARGRTREEENVEAAVDVQLIERHRSATWIIGTSLIDESIFLGLAAWIFCRRDY